MKWRWLILASVLMAGIYGTNFLSAQLQPAAEPTPKIEGAKVDRSTDQLQLQSALKDYGKAIRQADIKAIADAWTEEAEYTTSDGVTFPGRTEIQKLYAGFFEKNPKPIFEFKLDAIKFLSKDSATVDGTLKLVAAAKEEPINNAIHLLAVREEGRWRFASVSEESIEETTLADLSWLIGTWTTKRDGIESSVTYEYDLNQTIIRGRYTVKSEEKTTSGMQILFLDKAANEIQSQGFDGMGGVSSSVWTKDDNRWVIQAQGSGADGTQQAGTNILVKLNEDQFTWQTVERSQDGEALPDLPPIKVTRSTPLKK
jgi:uncharacterized protein (TIGR02246 family)